ncbi:MAG: serine hydrolase domain-containing protein [Minicystis sp.]
MELAEREDRALADRVTAVLEKAVTERRIVGAVALVAKDDAIVARRAVGLADRERGVPMRDGTPFRLASLTKPIVATVTLAAIARGKLTLDTPVHEWLPGFTPTEGGRRATITVRHLLTHTSGLGYAFLEGRDGPYRRANVSDALDQPGLALDENLARLAKLPLHFAPGSDFRYSLAYDVLGGVLERACDRPLPALVAGDVTGPLGMTHTAFTPPNPSALATPYADGSPEPVRIEDGTYVPLLGAPGGVVFAPSRALDPRSYASGGAGLVGTADDFLRFLEAVRTRALPGVPAALLDAMTSDQIAPIASPVLGEGWGFGFGVSVLRDPVQAGSPLHAGSYRWGGAWGHTWVVDPVAKTSAVLLTNTAFEGMIGKLRDEVTAAVSA